jgi:hypothetical protein
MNLKKEQRCISQVEDRGAEENRKRILLVEKWPSCDFLKFRVYLPVGNEPEVNQKNPRAWRRRGEKKNNSGIFFVDFG